MALPPRVAAGLLGTCLASIAFPQTPAAARLAEAYPGVDIGARINAAFTTGASTDTPPRVNLVSGQTYTFSTTIRLPIPATNGFPILDCNGSTLHYTGSADAIFVVPGGAPPWNSGLIENCILTGTPSAANGIHQLSRIGMHYREVTLSGFTAPGAAGLLLDNTSFNGISTGAGLGWNERLDAQLNLFNNTSGILALGSHGGTNSFGYSRLELRCQVVDGQWCLTLDGNNRGADMYGGLITLLANATFTHIPGGLIRTVRQAVLRGPVTVNGESQGTIGGAALFTDGSSSIQGCGLVFAPGFRNENEGVSSRQLVSPFGPVCPTVGATFQPAPFYGNVAQARSSKWSITPGGIDYFMASPAGVEGGSPFTLWARNTFDPGDPEADGKGKVTVLRADPRSKSIGIGPGFDAAFPTHTLEFNGTFGNKANTFGVTASGNLYQPLHTPSSSHEPCIPGQFTDDPSFHYVCTAPNTWKRIPLSNF